MAKSRTSVLLKANQVLLRMPAATWTLLHQTLLLDSTSGAFDAALRARLRRALTQVENLTPRKES